MEIAVLLATYNRREKTLACLKSLMAQDLLAGINLQIHLTDDCSSDGTAVAVQYNFPTAFVYAGTGSLFWAGGMRNSWGHAVTTRPDFYLLLNDDTILDKNAVSTLVALSLTQGNTIAIGSTRHPVSGQQTYGGHKLKTKKFWGSLPVYSETQPIDCDLANANIMLVPHEVVKKIGILPDHFVHSLADFDYTLKATRAGIRLTAAPGFLGTCEDDHGKNWKSPETKLKERIAYLKSPKGLAYKEYLGFIKDHFPLSYPSSVVKLWLKTLFPVLWETFKKPGRSV